MAAKSPASVRTVTLPDGTVEMHFVVRVPPRERISSAMAFERDVRSATAKIGLTLMEYGLAAFDTEGEVLHGGGPRLTSKGLRSETYQTSFGAVTLSRHVYQPPAGGKTYVPLEDRARIIGLSTPLFASSIAASRPQGDSQPAGCPEGVSASEANTASPADGPCSGI